MAKPEVGEPETVVDTNVNKLESYKTEWKIDKFILKSISRIKQNTQATLLA